MEGPGIYKNEVSSHSLHVYGCAEREGLLPRSHTVTKISSNFHLALSNKFFNDELASLLISIVVISLTPSCISPRIFMKWCAVVSELEALGKRGGVFVLDCLADITAMSEKRKNSESKET